MGRRNPNGQRNGNALGGGQADDLEDNGVRRGDDMFED